MFDVRPVFNVVGLLVSCLGLTMLFPFALDLSRGNGHSGVFLKCALITVLTGGMIYLATRREEAAGADTTTNVFVDHWCLGSTSAFWSFAICSRRNRC